MSISRPALALALALVPACAESPSVELRWRIQGEDLAENDEPAELTSIRQCTEVGISKLRLTTRKDGFPIDIREIACFPEEFESEGGLAPGPELEPGTYELTLQGLRRSTDTPWADQASVSATVTVAGDAPIVLDDLLLPAPPTCDDGIDNDLDGYVDRADVDCRVTDPRESNQVTSIQFFVSPTFLGDNPYVTCGALGIVTFLARVDDDPSTDRQIGCSTLTSSFARRVDPDPSLNPHSVSITGLDFNGAPVTKTKVTSFDLTGTQGKPVDIDAAFDEEDLLEPLVAPLQFLVVFEAGPDAEKEFRYCAADSDSSLEITDISVEVVSLESDDPAGVPLDPPLIIDSGELNGTALDGEPFACQMTSLISESVSWGNYGLQITGRNADGDTCYATTDAIQAAPGILINAIVGRASDEGACAD